MSRSNNYSSVYFLYHRSSFEGFFASKGSAYALPDGDFARKASKHGGTVSVYKEFVELCLHIILIT